MDVHHRSPEDYFNELIRCIEKAQNQFHQFTKYAGGKNDKPEAAADFVDFYCDDFNDTLSDILASIGGLNDQHTYEYSYDSVTYRIVDTGLVLKELTSNKEMYIARIKEATVFVPQGSLAVWISTFAELEDMADELDDKFGAVGI